VEDFQGGSTWLGELSCAVVRRPAGLPAMGHGRGRREEGKDDGTYVQEIKTAGAWVKKELKLIIRKVKKKYFNTIFVQLFKIYVFCFMTIFI
jgi:hypothetical protein